MYAENALPPEALDEEAVHVPESDLGGRAITDCLDEELQIAAIIPPGVGVRAAAARPVDEPFDFG